MSKNDLAYLSLDELVEDTSAAASADFLVRYDDSAGKFVKVGADDLNANFGVTATAAELNYNDITTLGTGAASKAVVLDAGDDYTWPAAGVLTYGVLNDATDNITATAAEINRVCDSSIKIVALTATVAITALLHASKVCYVTGTAAAAYTLPEATGTGDEYRFIMGQVNTNGTTFVAADTTNTSYHGIGNILDVDATAQTAFFTVTAGGTDTVTFNGTTTGGRIGDIVTFIDLATDVWHVHVEASVPAGQNVATMFSSAA